MILEAKNVTKCYGKKTALADFSYSFQPGIYGLLGPNGAGKSTLMGVMTTNLKTTSGQMLLDGRDIRELGREYRRCIGYMPQQQKLYDGFPFVRFLYCVSGYCHIYAEGSALIHSCDCFADCHCHTPLLEHRTVFLLFFTLYLYGLFDD